MQKIAILPASGIGDALLMMIAAHACKQACHEVTVYHNHLPALKNWFPGYDLRAVPSETELVSVLRSYSLIIVENDNSSKVRELIHEFRPVLSLFYPSYKAGKHAPLYELDQCFDPTLPMADNVGIAIGKLLGLAPISKENGIEPLDALHYRSQSLQVLIHPTSSSPQKNWKASGFLALSLRLKQQGFSPLFVVSPEERSEWEWIKQKGLPLKVTSTLSDLASLVYESGYVIGNDSLIGHLASNLQIPTLIIADDPIRLQLWRPGWYPGKVVFPPSYLPRFMRKKHWQHFVGVNQALNCFLTLE